MGIQRLTVSAATTLHHPGKDSVQLIWPETAPEARITMTRVTMAPGAVSERHSHAEAEQTWIVEAGTATLLLTDTAREEMRTGDIIRTPPGVVHGIENTGTEPFVYLTVTTPPEDMTKFYVGRREAAST